MTEFIKNVVLSIIFRNSNKCVGVVGLAWLMTWKSTAIPFLYSHKLLPVSLNTQVLMILYLSAHPDCYGLLRYSIKCIFYYLIANLTNLLSVLLSIHPIYFNLPYPLNVVVWWLDGVRMSSFVLWMFLVVGARPIHSFFIYYVN